jgi:hypothetical protein
VDRSALIEYIITRLSGGVQRDTVTAEVCEKGNLSWADAHTLVLTVEDENQARINRKQHPLLFWISIVGAVGGAGLMIYSLLDIYQAVRQALLTQESLQGTAAQDLLGALNIPVFLIGLGLTIAGLRGVRASNEAGL